MSWGIVAVAAVTVVGSAVQGQKQNKANSKNLIAAYQQQQAAYEDNAAENKAISEANLQNQIRTGYRVGLLNIQQANAKKKMFERGISLSRAKQEALGAVTANAAASGTVGASVEAVVQDINGKLGDAEASLDADWAQTVENFDVQLHDILMQGSDALRSSRKINTREPAGYDEFGMGDALMNGVVAGASAYAGSRMSLGLGNGGSSAGTDVAGSGMDAGVNGVSTSALA